MRTVYDNTSNTKYVIKDCDNVYKTQNCSYPNKTTYAKIRSSNPTGNSTIQNLPDIPNYNMCDPNRQSDNEAYMKSVNRSYNSGYTDKHIYNISPYIVNKMRAYRNYLNSVKLTKKCDKDRRSKMKNRHYINQVDYQGYYELIQGTNTYKLFKLINGTYVPKGCVTVPAGMSINQYINNQQNNRRLRKKEIYSYNGNIPLFSHYEFCNGSWSLISMD
jgi:hypothetical protein